MMFYKRQTPCILTRPNNGLFAVQGFNSVQNRSTVIYIMTAFYRFGT